jgi:sporulation integral membrane protein YtvI
MRLIVSFYKENRSVINKLALVAIFIVFVGFFLSTLFMYVAPFVFGYIFSIIMEPFVNLANKRLRLNRGLCAIISVVILIGAFLFLGNQIIVRIIAETRDISDKLPVYSAQFTDTLNSLSDKIYEFVPVDLWEFVDSSIDSFVKTLTDFLSGLAKNGSISLVSSLPMIVTNVILTLISSFFFIKDKRLISASFKKYLPAWISGGLITIRTGFLKAFFGYIKAQAIIMSVTTAACILGLTIIRSPYSLVLGLVIGFVDALPIFGSGAILWPWALFSLLSRNYAFAVGLMIIYGVIFLTRQLLEPKVLSSQIGIHPLVTLMSIYAGLRLFGVLGIIAGPMIIITTKIIFEMPDKTEPKPEIDAPPDSAVTPPED